MKRNSGRWRRSVSAAACTALLFALFVISPPLGAQTLKMATLAPQGSIWDQAIRAMGERWNKETAGRVQLRVYAGGVAGDESDALRKARAGQFQGLAITVAGLTEIDSAFNVFQIPMYFASFEELYFVLAELRPALEARLAAKGYVLLHWGHGGWIHLFSRAPIRTIADLKQQKLFVWAGDDSAVQSWKKNGYQPVPLAATDILLGFQTKMIDVVPTTPIAALTLQWYRQTPAMMGLGLAPLVGGVVVTKSAWEKIAPADRELLMAAARATEKELEVEVPKQDKGAIEQMRQRGLTVVDVTPEQARGWQDEAKRFAVAARDGRVPPEILEATEAAVKKFRSRTAGEATPAAVAKPGAKPGASH
ncbi:MAG: TRAP transporter substrate-binding protein DctP [Thermoanaerobaculia bacterium]